MLIRLYFIKMDKLKININKKLDKYRKKNYSYRKSLLHLIFWIPQLFFVLKDKKRPSYFKDQKVHIGLYIQGAVGDLIYISKYVYALKKKFEHLICIDILILEKKYHQIGHDIFKGLPIDNIHFKKTAQYDCELFLFQFPKVDYIDNLRLMKVEFKPVWDYIKKIEQFGREYDYLYTNDYSRINYSLIHDRYRENQFDVYDLLEMKLIEDYSIPIFENPIEVLSKFELTENLYITVQTGGGKWIADHAVLDTRKWDICNYNDLILKLKKDFPDYKIVQIGESYQIKIENIDVNLLGKTNFEELKVILKNAKLHISQEGGMPILRHFLSRKTSCVLFGPSNINFLKFSENINVSANLGCNCEGLIKEWAKKCDLYNAPLCMKKISSDQVFALVKSFLSPNYE